MGANISTLAQSIYYYKNNYENIKKNKNEFKVKTSFFSSVILPNFNNIILIIDEEGITLEKNDVILKKINWKKIYKWTYSEKSITIFFNKENIKFYYDKANEIVELIKKYKLNI
jgi:hypothetical protein